MSKERIRRHYESRIRDGAAGYEAADWSDLPAQQTRFAVLIGKVALAGRSLLDVGCATGDLWAFLRERNIEVDYFGVDIVAKMIAEACRRHPDGRFETVDVFQPDSFPPGSFDVVFCSGAFNLNVGNNRQFLPEAVARLVELSRETAAFNLLHARAESQYSHCVYWQPDDVRKMLADFPVRVDIVDNYLPNDFTVICRK